MFFPDLAASYLQRVPSSCPPGCREPQDSGKNTHKTAQMFPLSALLLEAAPLLFSSLSLAGESAVTGLRGVVSAHGPLTHL